ncbi:hypothetical protein N836_10655 [Leptolyngbya sp. Heron Island J]|nr:hypothetical protein N836_10655 [Leptolyngbya sp. Heron Island J]
MVNSTGQSVQRSAVWLLDAAKRLFSPNDNDYPKTGVQPFEGDIQNTSQH